MFSVFAATWLLWKGDISEIHADVVNGKPSLAVPTIYNGRVTKRHEVPILEDVLKPKINFKFQVYDIDFARKVEGPVSPQLDEIWLCGLTDRSSHHAVDSVTNRFCQIMLAAGTGSQLQEHIESGCVTAVHYGQPQNRAVVLEGEGWIGTRQVSDDLLFSDMQNGFIGRACFLDGIASGLKSLGDEHNTYRSDAGAERCCDEHQKSPISHLPLGLKVFLGTPFFTIGFWIGLTALRSAAKWGSAFATFVLLIGSGLITAGVLVVIL